MDPTALANMPTQETVIDGHRYCVTALPARQSRRLLMHIINAVGPELGPVFRGEQEIGNAIARICGALTPELFDKVCDQFAVRTRVNGEDQLSMIFDYHFAARSGAMMLWLKFCLESEYGDFLAVLQQAGNANANG